MPFLMFAFRAGEFLDEELELASEERPWILDGWEVINPASLYPYEWWGLK